MTQWQPHDAPALALVQSELDQARLQIRKLHTLLMSARRHASTARAMEVCRTRGTPPRGLVEFQAQFGEDCLLYELFEGKQDGFFVEAGAFNGVDFSVSYAFEQLGWSGLLVEAIPERAIECAQRRGNSRVVHAALGAPGVGPTTTLLQSDDVYGGMCSSCVDLTANSASARPMSAGARPVIVPARTLDELLNLHAGPIDFVVLDLEGAEHSALTGFDLAQHRPAVLIIEDNKLGQNSPVCAYMERQPYTLAGWVEMNAVYIRNEERGLLERFKKLSVFGW